MRSQRNPPSSVRLRPVRTKSGRPNLSQTDTPGPGSYSIPSTFETTSGFKLKGKLKSGSTEQTPGPGEYQWDNKFGSDGLAFSLKSRSSYGSNVAQSSTPAPGAYTIASTIGTSPKFSLSGRTNPRNRAAETPGPIYTVRSSIGQGRAYSLAPKLQYDGQRESKQTPAPGSYNVQSGFGSPKKGFTLKSRTNSSPRNDVPGPGQYTTRSDITSGPKHVFGTGQ